MTPLEAELTAALAASQQQVVELRQENDFLKQKIDALVRRIFGAKSEQLNPAQLELLLTGMENPPPPGKDGASAVASTAGDTLGAAPADHTLRSSKPARRPRLPEHLPIVEEIMDPDIVKADPEAWRCIGQEVTEQLDYTPGKFWRRRLIRRKYVRKHQPEAPPVIAPLTTLQDACLAAPGLLAAIIVGKYCDHLPLYRQEQIFKTRHQIHLPRQPKPPGGAEIASRRLPEGRRSREAATEANHGPLAGHGRRLAHAPVEGHQNHCHGRWLCSGR